MWNKKKKENLVGWMCRPSTDGGANWRDDVDEALKTGKTTFNEAAKHTYVSVRVVMERMEDSCGIGSVNHSKKSNTVTNDDERFYIGSILKWFNRNSEQDVISDFIFSHFQLCFFYQYTNAFYSDFFFLYNVIVVMTEDSIILISVCTIPKFLY